MVSGETSGQFGAEKNQLVDHCHEFADVRGYLHHREPYLMLESIVEITPERCVASTNVSRAGDILSGHFPGAPILPGAIMQEMTTQAAGVLIAARYNPMAIYNTEDPDFNPFALGVLVKVRSARYRGFARPGQPLLVTARLVCRVDQVFDFQGQVACGGAVIMKNQFQLANIPTAVLKG